MPLDTLAEGLIRGVLHLIFELVFEISFRGSGRLILRLLRPGREPGDRAAMAVGALFWGLLLGGLLWFLWSADA